MEDRCSSWEAKQGGGEEETGAHSRRVDGEPNGIGKEEG